MAAITLVVLVTYGFLWPGIAAIISKTYDAGAFPLIGAERLQLLGGDAVREGLTLSPWGLGILAVAGYWYWWLNYGE